MPRHRITKETANTTSVHKSTLRDSAVENGRTTCNSPAVARRIPASDAAVSNDPSTNTVPIHDVPRHFGPGSALSASNGVRLCTNAWRPISTCRKHLRMQDRSTAQSSTKPNRAACTGVLISSPEPITEPVTTIPGPMANRIPPGRVGAGKYRSLGLLIRPMIPVAVAWQSVAHWLASTVPPATVQPRPSPRVASEFRRWRRKRNAFHVRSNRKPLTYPAK